MELTREDLYELVWSMPMTKVGEKLGVFDVAVRKVCVKMKIPRPPQGYWLSERLQKRPKPVLPDFNGGDQVFISPSAPKVEPEETPPELPEVVLKHVAKGFRASVTAESGETKRLLKSGFVDRYGFLRSGKPLPVPVVATKATLQRALLLADWVIKMSVLQGFVLAEQRNGYGRDFEIKLEKKAIKASIQIKERVTRRDVPVAERRYDYGDKYRYEQTGELGISFECGWGNKKTIKDKGDLKIESRLLDMATALNIYFQRAVEREKQRAIEARERQIQYRNDHRGKWVEELESKRLENFNQMRQELERNRLDREFIDSVGFAEHHGWLEWVKGKLVVPDLDIVERYSASDRDICISIERLKAADASDDDFAWPKPGVLGSYY